MSESFKIEVLDGVYPPAADTYLLLDAIMLESTDVVLDVGCGVGVVIDVDWLSGGRNLSLAWGKLFFILYRCQLWWCKASLL